MSNPQTARPGDRERLQRAALRYEALLTAEGAMVWVIDPARRPTGRSEAWERYTGQTFAEYSGLGWLDAIHPDDRERIKAAADDAAESGRRLSIELRIRRVDGAWRRHVIRAIPVRDAGTIVEWIGTAHDVEDDRRTADEQRDLRGRLLTLTDGAEALLSTRSVAAARASVIDLAERVLPGDAHAVWWLDRARAEWQIVHARGLSDAFIARRLSGGVIQFSEPIEAVDIDGAPLLTEYREAYAHEQIRSLLSIPLPIGGERMATLAVYYRARHEVTDTERRVGIALGQMAAAALWNAETYEALHNARTLAEHRAARMAALAEEAERANEAKDNFLAILSHELRTPLNAIMGWSRMLRDGLPDDMVRHGVEVIGRNARAQKQLIEELLDVARIASGRLDLNRTVVNLVETGRLAVDSALPTAHTRDITLAFETTTPELLVEGDADRLQQVAANLVANALKFSERGARVTLRIDREGGARLMVSDTGVGIPPAFLPHMFDRFSQFDSSLSRPYRGLGLGLWVVKQIVDAHGGTVAAHSDGHGHGTTIAVTLPVRS